MVTFPPHRSTIDHTRSPAAFRGHFCPLRLPSLRVIGWSNALAAGLMFGVAYTILTAGLPEQLAAGGLGALLGIGFVRATFTGTGELDLEGADADPTHGHKALLADTLHAAHEGIAIGAATASPSRWGWPWPWRRVCTMCPKP